jgi:hypothetical protein
MLINFSVVEFESSYLLNKQMDYTENTRPLPSAAGLNMEEL